LSDSNQIEDIFHAIRNWQFERISAPQSNYALAPHIVKTIIQKILHRITFWRQKQLLNIANKKQI
jgi:hypothetical protein